MAPTCEKCSIYRDEFSRFHTFYTEWYKNLSESANSTSASPLMDDNFRRNSESNSGAFDDDPESRADPHSDVEDHIPRAGINLDSSPRDFYSGGEQEYDDEATEDHHQGQCNNDLSVDNENTNDSGEFNGYTDEHNEPEASPAYNIDVGNAVDLNPAITNDAVEHNVFERFLNSSTSSLQSPAAVNNCSSMVEHHTENTETESGASNSKKDAEDEPIQVAETNDAPSRYKLIALFPSDESTPSTSDALCAPDPPLNNHNTAAQSQHSYQCHVCDIRFSSRSCLNGHLRLYHHIQPRIPDSPRHEESLSSATVSADQHPTTSAGCSSQAGSSDLDAIELLDSSAAARIPTGKGRSSGKQKSGNSPGVSKKRKRKQKEDPAQKAWRKYLKSLEAEAERAQLNPASCDADGPEASGSGEPPTESYGSETGERKKKRVKKDLQLLAAAEARLNSTENTNAAELDNNDQAGNDSVIVLNDSTADDSVVLLSPPPPTNIVDVPRASEAERVPAQPASAETSVNCFSNTDVPSQPVAAEPNLKDTPGTNAMEIDNADHFESKVPNWDIFNGPRCDNEAASNATGIDQYAPSHSALLNIVLQHQKQQEQQSVLTSNLLVHQTPTDQLAPSSCKGIESALTTPQMNLTSVGYNDLPGRSESIRPSHLHGLDSSDNPSSSHSLDNHPDNGGVPALNKILNPITCLPPTTSTDGACLYSPISDDGAVAATVTSETNRAPPGGLMSAAQPSTSSTFPYSAAAVPYQPLEPELEVSSADMSFSNDDDGWLSAPAGVSMEKVSEVISRFVADGAFAESDPDD